jgi:NAD(P)-dependent dehydrogenase (short-subunit alcohol dehydrogenase family)
VERRFFETARPSSIIQRFATPEEVAAMIAYVCSELASATTGAALPGGWRGDSLRRVKRPQHSGEGEPVQLTIPTG